MTVSDIRPEASDRAGVRDTGPIHETSSEQEPVIVDRYTIMARINHWITATSFVLLVLSGLALFHPAFYFLTGIFGGGSNTRAIHPWIGVVLILAFVGLFLASGGSICGSANKAALKRKMKLETADTLLFGVISRLTWQKGLDMLVAVLSTARDRRAACGARHRRT